MRYARGNFFEKKVPPRAPLQKTLHHFSGWILSGSVLFDVFLFSLWGLPLLCVLYFNLALYSSLVKRQWH